MGKGKQRPMTVFIQIVLGVLFLTPCSISPNLNCTKLTTSCPNAARWLDRTRTFNCPGNKRYICLMASGNELREGCIFNITIKAGRVGCPFTKECDIRTGQPLLVAHNNYLHCPPDLDGCPPRNHSGYSILEIYKYARCQGRNASGERFVSPDEVTGIPTTITPSEIPRHVNWTLSIISIAVGFITVSLISILIAFRNKIERSISKDSEVLRKMSLCSVSSNDSESSLPLLSGHQYDNALHHSTISSSLIIFPLDIKLHDAASNGNIDTMKKLIDAKADVNIKSQGQNTPLHKAAFNGHMDIVKILIDAKADVDAQNVDNTPLHNAASNGQLDIVKILIAAKADVNAKGQGKNTPLHKAALNGHSDTVKILIHAKADVDAQNVDLNTPLHVAASNGNIDTVKILVDANADVNVKGQDTPLHIAASNGNIDIVKILIDAKADVNAKDQCQKTQLYKALNLIRSVDDVALLSLDHNTPLHNAASNGHTDIVKILIDAKGDVNAKGQFQNTPLHMAVLNSHSDAVKILIDAKADIDAQNLHYITTLHMAASKGHIDIVKILIDAKADINAKDQGQNTPLHNASFNGHVDIVKILIDAKANVDAQNVCRNTPLHKAASKGRGDIVKILIDAKAGVNVKGWYQDTPLHKAAASGHIDTVKTLINAKADVNAMGQGKNTPLHEASRYSRAEIIEILLSSGADFLIRNKKGEIAEQLGNLQSKQAFKDCYRKVPNEIKRLGDDAIKQCLKSLNEDAVIANVVSCMVVGHVGAGKTTLVNNLLGLPRKKTKMTNGIDLQTGKIFANVHTGEWHIQVDEQSEKIIGQNDITEINVWDFDGKMMYYTMHQDHLSPQRLYFLVFNASLGMDGIVEDHSVDPYSKGKRSLKDHIDLWVTTITTYFQSDGRGFPKIAIVGTHIDKLTDTLKISRIIEEIKIKFQPLIDEWRLIVHEDLFINALDMNAEAIKKLRDVIISCGKSCLQYGQMIPLSWNDLHQQLILRKSENVIAFDELERMNNQMEKPLNEKELILCIEYFHRLGHLLFFNDEEMKDHIVLDPTWITNSMLSFITCSKSTSENGRVQKWLLMQTTGIIEHAYSSEESLTNTETRDRRNLHRFMKKLDLVSKPKVYNAEGFEECQNYFYMPCIVNRDISPYALSLIENQEAVHVSFSFSTVIPPAVYNRLVASSLSLWPVFDNHIYNGIIILRSGPLHLIAFRREDKQINISVVHLQDQRHITSCLCRTIVQFAEERLTWIFSNYNTSTMETKSLFHITYNSTAAESLKARKIKEEDELCEDRCNSELTQTASYIVNDLFLMRVALMLQDYDIYPLAAKVYKHESAADDLQSDYNQLRTSDLAWVILIEWKRQVQNGKRTPTLLKLRNEACINSHILCKVMRFRDEHPYRLDPAYLQTDVHSELLHAVADRISSEYIHVGLELGLKADGILKLLKKFKGRTVELIRAMLQDWYNKNRNAGHVKVVTLATALLNARCDISVLHEFEKLHDRNRQTARQK